jgi:GPH family glycoside/pentoside/hexuronide:cation symporter
MARTSLAEAGDAEAEAAALRRTKLGLPLKAIYGVGAFADACYQAALNTFLFFYLTQVCGLGNSLAGATVSLGLVIDAAADPLVGSLSDNARTPIGRRHPFMIGGILAMAVGLGMLFSLPRGMAGLPLAAAALAVLAFLRIAHSTFFLPYVGLGAELSDNYAERTDIVASRFFFSVFGGVAVIWLGRGVFMTGGEGLMNRAAYAPFGWASAGLALAAGLACAFGTLPALRRLHTVAAARHGVARQFVADVVEAFHNRTFVVVFASLLAMFVSFGVIATLTLDVNGFFYHLPSDVLTLVLYATPLGTFAGVPISLFLLRGVEKRAVVIGGLFFYAATLALPPLLKIAGWLPLGVALSAIVFVANLLLAAIAACVGIAFQSAMADAADEHEHLYGTRREAVYYAGLNFSVKAAAAGGALLGGLTLDLIGFPTGVAAKSGFATAIPTRTLTELGLFFGPGAAALMALSGGIFLAFGLTRDRHAAIQQALAQRRAGVA